MRHLFRQLNSLLGRSALLMITLVALVQLTIIILVYKRLGQHGSQRDAQFVQVAFQIAAIPAERSTLSQYGITYIAPSSALLTRCPNHCQPRHWPFENLLSKQLGPDYLLVLDKRSGNAWVKNRRLGFWLYASDLGIPEENFDTSLIVILLLAIVASLLLYWQLRRPIRKLSHAASLFRQNGQPSHLQPSGPQELSALMQQFNEMTENLHQLEQERAIMLAGMAHDLRSPVTRMQVRANLLNDESLKAGFLKDCVALSRLIRQFIDFSKTPEHSAPVPVNLLCQQLSQRYRESMELSLDLQSDETVCLPEQELERILINLIDNALYYGVQPIILQTQVTADRLVIKVIDHGHGMSPEQWSTGVKPFVRLDKSRGGAHSGLGLAIVQRLVHYLQGEIQASRQPDHFEIQLTFPL
ncbi:ATP-binding protein [Celerinatantimonas yamalensis]|uniref:histidine kinase n=1 Tax=Celerinatantimonas yamalensis TaxID=559956 RepID=A0ABW9G6M7_9GAMM